MATILIRDVPEDLHRQLTTRAALARMSRSAYLLRELRRLVGTTTRLASATPRPAQEELLRRVATREPVRTHVSPADAVRAERAGR